MAMKNAKTYEKKIEKLLAGVRKVQADKQNVPLDEAIGVLIESVLLLDATKKHVERAFRAMEREFVDFNEARVAPVKEIAECLGKGLPNARGKAEILATVLNGVYGNANDNSIEYLETFSKRDIRRHLRELGLPAFSEAVVSQKVFGVHAIPVDPALVELLAMNRFIHPDATVEETQAFLERIIPQKNGPAAHRFFRNYVAKHFKALEKKRREDAERRKKQEAEAAQKAEEEEARKAAAKKTKTAKKRSAKTKTAKKRPAKTKTARKTPKRTTRK